MYTDFGGRAQGFRTLEQRDRRARPEPGSLSSNNSPRRATIRALSASETGHGLGISKGQKPTLGCERWFRYARSAGKDEVGRRILANRRFLQCDCFSFHP